MSGENVALTYFCIGRDWMKFNRCDARDKAQRVLKLVISQKAA
jgi:hypothetical protein